MRLRLACNLDLVSRFKPEGSGQPFPYQHILGIVLRPRTANLPPGINGARARPKFIFAKSQLLGEIRAQQRDAFAADVYRYWQHRRKSNNVVVPEHAMNLRQVGLVEVRAVTRRLQINAGNLKIERVLLRSDYQVCYESAKLAADFVTNVSGHCDHGGRNAYAQCDGSSRQQLAPLLPPERFVDQTQKHELRLEHTAARRDVRLPDNDRVCRSLRLQRNGIAATRHADRLRVNWRGAVLAHHAVLPLVE